MVLRGRVLGSRNAVLSCRQEAIPFVAIGPLYRPLVEVVRQVGVDVAAVLAQLNLTTELLFAAETRLSPDQGRALGRALIRALPPDVDRCELGLRAAELFVVGDADL